MNRIISIIKNRKYYLMGGLALLLILIWSLGNFSTFSLPSMLCLTLIIILLAHMLAQFLIEKMGVESTNPHLILWMGLISTFIAFTLSTYASQIQQENIEKKRLIGLLDMTQGLAEERLSIADSNLIYRLRLYLENNQEIDLIPIDISVTSLFPTIKENGEFIAYLSPEFVNNVLFRRNKRLDTGIKPADYDNELERIKAYHTFIIENKFLIDRIDLEKKFIEGKINKEQFYKELELILKRWGELKMYVMTSTDMDDYLELKELTEKSIMKDLLKGNYSSTFFWNIDLDNFMYSHPLNESF